MTAAPRTLLLPAAALVAVLALLGVQLAAGGASYRPAAPLSACAVRPLPAATDDLDPIVQDVVVAGISRAACDLHVTRERLLLALPSPDDRAALLGTPARTQVFETSFKAGMLAEVARFDAAKRLPKASALLTTYADQLGLPDLAVSAIKQLPGGAVDSFLPTGEILERAIDGLDVGDLVDRLDRDPASLETTLRAAITDAAIAEAKAQITEQLPSGIKQLLGLG